jgi:ribosomal protein S18 acetylase RimI-like enzyme
MIERLRPGDGVRLRTLRLRALADAPDAFGSTLAEALVHDVAAWEQQIANLPTFVWREAEVDAGMVRAAPHADDPHAGYLISLWVAPEVRGRRIAAALAGAVVAWAHDRSLRRLLLDVGHHNRSALRLYDRLGFQPTGRRSRLPAPRDHLEEWEMALDLTARAAASSAPS